MSDAAANADLPGEAVSTAESSIPLDRTSRQRPNLTSGPLSTRLLVYAGVVVLAGVDLGVGLARHREGAQLLDRR